MEAFKPKPFGEYYLLERIAVGGMAEIFKAKTYGVGGFEKLLAIKRILPHHMQNQEFITMLIDEAKIAVSLNHVNIVQVFDLGKIDNDYFIAMEYVEGRDLRSMMRRCKKAGIPLTIENTVYIILEICKGLDYAHRKTDRLGRSLGVVHRDISPQNILISFEGEVKIVDFGIAKAANKVTETDSGVLKGKFSYMSPEQAGAQELDQRTDIYSTGIIMYELLAGEKLYSGDSHLAILEKIRGSHIEPPFLPAHVPSELEFILAQALTHNADDRFQYASDFQVELTKFLYSASLDFTARNLANLMKRLFQNELVDEQKREKVDFELDEATRSVMLRSHSQSLVSKTDFAYAASESGASKLPVPTAKNQTIIKRFQSMMRSRKKGPGLEEEVTPAPAAPQDELIDRWEARGENQSAQAQRLAHSQSLLDKASADSPHEQTEPLIRIDKLQGSRPQSAAADAELFTELNRRITKLSTKFSMLFQSLAPKQKLFIGVLAFAFLISLLTIVAIAVKKPNENEVAVRPSPESTPTPLPVPPVTTQSVAVATPYASSVPMIQASPVTEQPTAPVVPAVQSSPLDAVATTTYGGELPANKAASLRLETEPPGATVKTKDGRLLGVTPLEIRQIPAEEDISLSLQLNDYKDYLSSTVFKPGEQRRLHVPLEPIFGSIEVSSVPAQAQVFIDQKFVGETPLHFDRVYPNRPSKLTLKKVGYEDWATPFSLKPKESRLFSKALEKAFASLVIQSSPPGASIILNGASNGITPAKFSKLTPGVTYLLVLRQNNYRDWVRKVELDPTRATHVVAQMEVQNHKYGTLFIDSEPTGAMIFVNGAPLKEKTPVVMDRLLTNKQYVFKILLENYQPEEFRLNISPEQLTTQKVRLQRLMGRLTVRSTPPNAKIFLNDRLIGETPLAYYPVNSGVDYLLVIRKDGYKDQIRRFKTQPNENVSLNVSLE